MAEPVYFAEYRRSWALVMGIDDYRAFPHSPPP
jgi:hypothetical protein